MLSAVRIGVNLFQPTWIYVCRINAFILKKRIFLRYGKRSVESTWTDCGKKKLRGVPEATNTLSVLSVQEALVFFVAGWANGEMLLQHLQFKFIEVLFDK